MMLRLCLLHLLLLPGTRARVMVSVDLGTDSARADVFDAQGHMLASTEAGWTEQQPVRLRSAERGPAMAAASGSKASYAPVSQAEGTEASSVYADDESEAPTKCVHKSRPLVSRSIRARGNTQNRLE